jgi:acyl-CoA thioester hydrolase
MAPQFRFSCPILVRYGDLDPQGHVNNARVLTYIEQARITYLQALTLWDGHSFLDLGLIVADVHVSYLAPIFLNQAVKVGMRVARLGHKSLTFEYQLEDEVTHTALAKGETVMVAFDYRQRTSIPVPEAWREKIALYEGIPPHS